MDKKSNEMKPQISGDEVRFENLNIQHSSVFPGNHLIKSPQSTQRSQSTAIPATWYEKAQRSGRGTRMTRIARIFTDERVSASSEQSMFYFTPSAFISFPLRPIFVSLSDRTQKIQFKLFLKINENVFVWEIKKGGKLDERFTVS